MERIIKLASDNAFSEKAVPGTFTNSKLLDLTIPGNATYDLSKSYININMSVENSNALGNAVAGILGTDTALYSSQIVLQQDIGNTANSVAEVATLVRNAQMESQNRGMVESIRRVDTLRTLLYYLENDVKEIQDGLDKFGTFFGRRGLGNRTGNMVQQVITNVDNTDTADLSQKSNSLSNDFRINLSDLFGVGNAMWNGRVYGDTRINLELNINKLRLLALGGSEATDLAPNQIVAGSTYGSLAVQNAVAQGTPLSVVTTTATYKDPDMNFPFWVGQAVEVNGNDSVVGGPFAASRVVIDSIAYQNNNSTATPSPTNAEVMIITFRTPFYTTPGAQGNANITALTMKAVLPNLLLSQILINRAELVLTEMVGVEGPDEIDYRTYSTEEQNGNGQVNFFHQYAVEPNAQNLIVAHCDANEIMPSRSWDEYRIAINNIDQTGNRSVFYKKNLHQDRVLRFMNNRGQDVSNIGMNSSSCDVAQGDAQQPDITPICETLPLTAGSKTVTLQLASVRNVNDVIAYKELVRTI